MMGPIVTIVEVAARRFALRLVPETVRAVVPPDEFGAYMLLRRGRPVYVGRSDLCVRTRLVTHPLLGIATHFVWEPCRSRISAFALESFWFHRLHGKADVMNLIHPASPEDSGVPCPFCSSGEMDALARVLTRQQTPAGKCDRTVSSSTST